MKAAILELLERHGPLGHEQIAELSGDRPGQIRQPLEKLRERDLIALVAVGKADGPARSYWCLTNNGRDALRR